MRLNRGRGWGRSGHGAVRVIAVRFGVVGRRPAARPVGHSGHDPDPLFHFLTGLEGDDVFGLDVDLGPGPRIAGLAGLPPLDLEDAEVPQFDSTFFDQRLHDRVEGPLDDLLGLELRQVGAFGNLFDDFFLGHVRSPVAAGRGVDDPWMGVSLKIVMGRVK